MTAITVIFVDEHSTSENNGIGTYRNILLSMLNKEVNVTVILISLNSQCTDFLTYTYKNGVEFAVPCVNGGNWRDAGEIIWPLLKQYIVDSPYNVVLFNHSPCEQNMLHMKREFPLSKIVFLIHNQGWCSPLFGDASLFLQITMGNKPQIVSEETFRRISNYYNTEQAIYRIADAVICLSESTDKYLRTIYKVPESKIYKIVNGIDLTPTCRRNIARARREMGLRVEDEVLIFVARPDESKGVIALFKAVEYVRQTHPYLRCILVGNPYGYFKYWEFFKNMSSNIIFTGQIANHDICKWYSIADVGILSSYSEQCSYTAMEMMNAGILIVSSNGNGLKDMFISGKNAFIANIGNVLQVDAYAHRLAKSIKQALNAPMEQKKQYAAYNRRLLRTKYSASAMANKYMKLFRKLISAE